MSQGYCTNWYCVSADIGSGSAFQTATPHSATLPRQAVAASWAAHCSRAIGQDQVEMDFTNLHVFFTIQYGLDSADSWQNEHPCKPGNSMLALAARRLLDQEAPERFPKPSGWSSASWRRPAIENYMGTAKDSSAAQEHYLLHTKVNKYKGLQDHQEWSDLLKPVLARYCKLR